MDNKKIKVLCVEDEQEIRDTMAEILRSEGFEVFEAVNGKGGLESFLQNKPDIIVSDIMMVELDGYGFLKAVRESKSKNNTIPFIFLSALGQKDNIIKGIDSSANDYLIKPIDFDLLIAKIKEKAANASKVQQLHNAGIKNIKNQIATIIPNEVSSYLDAMTAMLKNLKEEPYGPFPHRRYVEDISRIYLDSTKLKAAIINALDQNVIENRLNENEEIFSVCDFISAAIANLPDKIKSHTSFDLPYESEFLPHAKMDKTCLIEVMKKIIAGVIRLDETSSIRISMTIDLLNQMALIFYIKSKFDEQKISESIDLTTIEAVSSSQGCSFKISRGAIKDEISIIFSIPSYRLVKNG